MVRTRTWISAICFFSSRGAGGPERSIAHKNRGAQRPAECSFRVCSMPPSRQPRLVDTKIRLIRVSSTKQESA
jgi:hypothetical protein